MALPKYEASFRRVYGKYKSRAKHKGIAFDLDKPMFRHLCEQDCVYCGAIPTPPSPIEHAKFNGIWECNGLDRIDNTRGYVSGNVQPCCTLCNQLKSNLKEKDFLEHIQSIVSFKTGSIKED